MLTTIRLVRETRNKQIKEVACLSTDTKPTEGVANGSILIEMNTGKIYMFDEAGAEWLEVAGA